MDVGQGDAIILSCGGDTVLIDAGVAEAGASVNQHLKNNGITDLLAVIATHNHDDHIGGMPAALAGLMIDTVYSSPSVSLFYWFDNIQPVLKQNTLNVITPTSGDSFPVGDATLTFLNMDDPAASPNNRSLVFRADYENTSFLFVGDAEDAEEKQLLESEVLLKADVIKVGHHGGLGSTGRNFLASVSPSIAIISVGVNNDHGHPASETLSLLESMNINLYRTDLNGTVTCISDGENIKVEITKAAVN